MLQVSLLGIIRYAFYLRLIEMKTYEGPFVTNRDNGPISQKILLESELFVTQNVDIGVAYSCLK